MKRKFFPSLESDEVVPPPVDEAPTETPPEEIIDTKTEVEEATAEVTADAGVIDEFAEAINEGVEAVAPGVELAETLTAAVDSKEGVEEPVAKLGEVIVESMRVRLGAGKALAGVPACENFRSPKSRLEATRLALENTTETLKKIWAKIWEFVKSIPEKVQAYLKTLTNNYDSLIKQLNQLKGQKVEGTPAKEKLSLKSVAKIYGDGGLENVKKHLAAFTAAMEQTHELVKKAEGIKIGEGSEEALKSITEANIDTSALEGTGTGSEVAALSAGDISAVIDLLLKEAAEGKTVQAIEKEALAAFKHVEEAAKRLADNVDKIDEAKKNELKSLADSVNKYVKFLTTVTGKIPSLHFKAVKAGVDYVQASITNHKAEAATGDGGGAGE